MGVLFIPFILFILSKAESREPPVHLSRSMHHDDVPPPPPEPTIVRPSWRQYLLGVLMIAVMAMVAYWLLRLRHGG